MTLVEDTLKTENTINLMLHLLIALLISTSAVPLIIFVFLALHFGFENAWMRIHKFLKELVDEIDKETGE